MKIRTGFVSNSSSSSFMLVGKRLKDKEEIKKNLEHVIVLGKFLNDGYDVIEHVGDDYLDMLFKYPDNEFYLSYIHGDSYDTTITPKGLISKLKEFGADEDDVDELSIMTIQRDYHSSESPRDFYDRYDDDSDWD